jgi:hypothetical protein
MDRKRLFEPGDMVTTFTGQVGMVISRESLAEARNRYKEGGRPGRFFSPGCCQNPDYVLQVPVLFEDRTFDVMRAMNIKKTRDIPEEKRKEFLKMTEI